MRFAVVAVGRVKDRALRAAIDEYAGRVRRYAPLDEIEIAEARTPQKLEEAFERATAEATSIALEISGRALGREALARGVERAAARNKGIVAFLIGAGVIHHRHATPPADTDTGS